MYELTPFRNMNNVRSGDFILHFEIFKFLFVYSNFFGQLFY